MKPGCVVSSGAVVGGVNPGCVVSSGKVLSGAVVGGVYSGDVVSPEVGGAGEVGP